MSIDKDDERVGVADVNKYLNGQLPVTPDQRRATLSEAARIAVTLKNMPRFWAYKTILDYAKHWPAESSAVVPIGFTVFNSSNVASEVAYWVNAAPPPERKPNLMPDD